ncbi:hypothetical protein GCM10025867_46540 (plasmid) [Frondihabitans sucicola]|uniref:Uncharacterized protein n=1 Tax=Frondihabitans sucicola TaxID=1268041 RepID=A0ABN6Y8U4_9MICO|nr:hypothetical protein GCM10025867_46540 [Frondihabitans sucicola]
MWLVTGPRGSVDSMGAQASIGPLATRWSRQQVRRHRRRRRFIAERARSCGRFDSEPDANSAALSRLDVAEAIASGKAPATRYIVKELLDEDDELPYATRVLANDGRMLCRDI